MNARTLWELLRDTYNGWSADKAPRLGAALAYYTVFSLAPILVIAIGVAGLVFGQEAARGEIVGQIEEASGRRVEANRTVDPDLIGGVVLKVGTLEVDSSVRGRLDRLRRELAGATT